jgi:hypothetical protein
MPHLFQILIPSKPRARGGTGDQDHAVVYWLPAEAEELLRAVLGVYGQSPSQYFDELNLGRLPAPWAVICLDREYALSESNLTTSAFAGIGVFPYAQAAQPGARVGAIVVGDKPGLDRSHTASSVLAKAWEILKDLPTDQHWLVLLD